jgi:hypothetical protein
MKKMDARKILTANRGTENHSDVECSPDMAFLLEIATNR